MKVCIHGAKSTTVLRTEEDLVCQMVRDTSKREGWAYATILFSPDSRVVIASSGGPAPAVGSTHIALDVYEEISNVD
jgi:hypothetical protein